MIILWKGFGCIVPRLLILITFPLTLGLSYLAGISIMRAMALSLFVTGALLWFLDKELVKEDSTYVTVSKKKVHQHTFFFIRVKYWGAIMIVISLFLASRDIIKHLI